jgi:hypothetical protein
MGLTYMCPECGISPIEEAITGVMTINVFTEIPVEPADDEYDWEVATPESSYLVTDEVGLVGYFCGRCKQEIHDDDGNTCLSYYDLIRVLRGQPHNTETVVNKVVST